MTNRYQFLLTVLAALFTVVDAQVDLTATGGTTSQSYSTLKDAFDAINAGTHTGVIAIGISGDTYEATTASLNASGTGSASYSAITIGPTGGAARIIGGTITAGNPLIDLVGADNVTFNGLNSGGNSLTLVDSSTSSTAFTSTIRFTSGATNDTITNCTVLGASTTAYTSDGGTIYFSGDGLTANGNDNNVISNCNIGPVGASVPSKAIMGKGATTNATIGNSGIVIDNNNIYDFFSASVASAGVYTNAGCNTWTISNNRFYQTAGRTWTAAVNHRPIDITPTTSTSGAQGFTITGNTIGYASSSQTGTYSLTGSTGKFAGIAFNGITSGTTTTISNNTITAISVTGVTSNGAGTSSPFIALLLQTGLIVSNNNTVGSQSAADAIVFSTNTATTTTVYGIYNFTSDDWTASGNNVGGMTAGNASASGSFVVMGIRADIIAAKASTITSNIVGGTVANSMQNTSTSTGAQLAGIANIVSIGTYTSNTVRNLTGAGGTGTAASASVIGMLFSSTSVNNTVSGNTIHTLTNTNGSASTTVCGIQYTSSTGTNTIERNTIHSLSIANNNAFINGINVSGGTATYKNNVIRLGYDAGGNSLTAGGGISGINEVSGSGKFYFNSVYVGGSGVVGTQISYAFSSSVSSTARDYRDNIFVNARSGNGTYYVIKMGGSGINPTGLTLDYNIYLATGTGGRLALYSSSGYDSLNVWKAAIGLDQNSISYDPQFINPTGTSSTGDLHIHPTNATPIEGNGIDITSVTDDFDGATRSSLTPTDIGAYAGNFTSIDLIGPTITYTVLGNSTSSTTLEKAGFATITDVSGVNTSSGTNPRLYFKRTTDANAWNDNTSGTDGWKYVEAGNSSSPFDFTIDYSLLNGGTISSGTAIHYFVTAQDLLATPNVQLNSGTFAAKPSSVALTSSAFPIGGSIRSYYAAVATLSGSYDVGTSAPVYTTLKSFFDVVSVSVVGGNIVVNIVDNCAEALPDTLKEWTEVGAGSYTMTIKPTGGAWTVSGSFTGKALLTLNGADRVTIDGSTSGGTDRSLTFVNSSSASSTATILFEYGSNGAKNNTIKNCIVQGGAVAATGASNTTYGIILNASGGDFDNTVIDNNLVLQARIGIQFAGVAGATSDNGQITNNTIGSTTDALSCFFQGILVSQTDNLLISGNDIIGRLVGNAIGTGVATSNNTGIVLFGGSTNTKIRRNTIHDFNYSGTSGFGAFGIVYGAGATTNTGTTEISNNFIYDIKGDGDKETSTAANMGWLTAGICIYSNGTAPVLIYNNSINLTGNLLSGGTLLGSSACISISGTVGNGSVSIVNNILRNAQMPQLGPNASNNETMGIWVAGGGTYAIFGELDYNDYYIDGNQGQVVYLNSFYTGLNSWQTATGKDVASISGNPAFTGTSNLHIATTDQNSWNVNGRGVSIAGISSDVDGNSRSVAAGVPTDIGADEFTPDVGVEPYSADESGPPVTGTTTSYISAGRMIAEIVWGNEGTPPSSMVVRYYPGVPPPGANGTNINSHWDVEAVDGSDYTYAMRLYYTDAELNGIPESNLAVSKREPPYEWTYTGGFTNPSSNYVESGTLSSFSQFSLNDITAPLAVELASFTASATRLNAILSWTTQTESHNAGWEVERRVVTGFGLGVRENEPKPQTSNPEPGSWVSIAFVSGSGTSNSPVEYSYNDRQLAPGRYAYRIKQVDKSGAFKYTAAVEVEVGLAPREFTLSQNYPNPFNPSTTIEFTLPEDGRATLKVYNMVGQEVATLVNEELKAGVYQRATFNAAQFASGVYIARLESGENHKLVKMVLIK